MTRRPAPLARSSAAARSGRLVPAAAGSPAPAATPARPGGASGSRRGVPGRPAAPARRPSRRTVLVVLAVAALVAGAGWALLSSPLTRVEQVGVSGVSRTPAAAVVAAAGPQLGTPVLLWDADEVAARLRGQPYVASVALARGWPDRVEVVVTERVPVAAVPREGGGVLVVDAAGATVTRAPDAPAGLPVVEAATAQAGPPAVEAASAAARSLPAGLRADVASVGATGRDDVVLRLRDGAAVRWGGADRPRGKAAVLDLLRREAPDAGGYDVSAPGAPATWPRGAPDEGPAGGEGGGQAPDPG